MIPARTQFPRGPESKRATLRRIARTVLIRHGFQPAFSAAARTEARDTVAATASASENVRDLRSFPWISIDNDDSRDLDQLSVASHVAPGATKILVAVADVDAVVVRGSAIDRHAQANTTSIYTPAAMFPMLPEPLSTDLSSLGEDQDRLAVVVEMVVDQDGNLVRSDVYRAWVRNHAKLAYDAVAAWLDHEGPAPGRAVQPSVAEQLRVQDAAAQAMRRQREKNGALALDTIEARAVFDGEVLLDLRADAGNRAKELIEDLMVAANGVTARYLDAHGFPSIRRVLRSPERWQRIVELAATLGGDLPGAPSAMALDAFLRTRRAADPLRFPDLSLAVIKLLGSGEYAVKRPGQSVVGHFGLAVEDYTHATAPNRRYPDLITQRLLKAAIGGEASPYLDTELEILAEHCTLQEDSVKKVERHLRKSAAALLLSGKDGQQWDGIVTGASAKGTWVRILRPPVEGKVVVGFAGLWVGDRVHVELVGTDVERGFIDFRRTDSPS